MSTREGNYSWSRLPEEIRDLVLSFLPVPALCRCRSVCKQWNELFSKPSFHDLCDLNRRNHEGYLVVTRNSLDYEGWCWLDDAFRRTLCFLDVAEKRWYTTPADVTSLSDESYCGTVQPIRKRKHCPAIVPRLMAVDEGLVCKFSALRYVLLIIPSRDYTLVLYDPVAKSRWGLPASTYDGNLYSLVQVIISFLL